jgi:large subunit ribosomal protein L16
MLKPRKTKFRKYQKGKEVSGISLTRTQLNFGQYALKAMNSGKITSEQLEAARKAIVSKTKRLAKVWIRIYPDIGVSKKPAEVRMGKGKGNPEFWISKIQTGTIIFEMSNVTANDALLSFQNAAQKLPIKTKRIINIK